MSLTISTPFQPPFDVQPRFRERGQMKYGTNAGVNLRLFNWLFGHDSYGYRRDLTLRDIYTQRKLNDPNPKRLGILNIIRDRLEAAANTTDLYIDENSVDFVPMHPKGQPFINPTTAVTAQRVIDNYNSLTPRPSDEHLSILDAFFCQAMSPITNRVFHDLKRLGIYIPLNHSVKDDKAVRNAILDPQMWNVQLKNGIPNKVLGDATLRELYFTPARVLTNDARATLKMLKDFGILRPSGEFPHEADPRLAMLSPLQDDQIVRMTGPNGKCCRGGKCEQGLMGQYCQTVDPGNPNSGCNSMSDPC